uniref:Uncharacterized protein n=1 Tax=Accipiter nisus TaxID=211598 RepID=A0A8B9RU42_9AVES
MYRKSCKLLLVGMLNCQVAAEDLQKHTAELLRRDVVQEGVHHRAEVEEGVGYGKKNDVCSEVGDSPVLLWFSSSHDPSNLVWHPAYCQSCNNQSCEQKEEEGGVMHNNIFRVIFGKFPLTEDIFR